MSCYDINVLGSRLLLARGSASAYHVNYSFGAQGYGDGTSFRQIELMQYRWSVGVG